MGTLSHLGMTRRRYSLLWLVGAPGVLAGHHHGAPRHHHRLLRPRRRRGRLAGVEGQLSYRGLYVHAVRIHVPAEGLPQLRLAGGVPRHLADQAVLQTLLGGMAQGEVACMDSVLPSAAASTRLWPAMAAWARSAADSIPGEAAVS